MSWRYYITKGKNEKVESEGGFSTEDEAQEAAHEYLKDAASSIGFPTPPVYVVTTGLDFIKPDPASHD
jgi:hypothetical protein